MKAGDKLFVYTYEIIEYQDDKEEFLVTIGSITV
jgi:hypothetical protein